MKMRFSPSRGGEEICPDGIAACGGRKEVANSRRRRSRAAGTLRFGLNDLDRTNTFGPENAGYSVYRHQTILRDVKNIGASRKDAHYCAEAERKNHNSY